MNKQRRKKQKDVSGIRNIKKMENYNRKWVRGKWESILFFSKRVLQFLGNLHFSDHKGLGVKPGTENQKQTGFPGVDISYHAPDPYKHERANILTRLVLATVVVTFHG